MDSKLKPDYDKSAKLVQELDLATKLELKEPLSVEFLKTALAQVLLFERRQAKYGPKNIAGFGAFGCVVRANDKFERLKHMYGKRRKRSDDETIIDSYRDISNYVNIAIMCECGLWPL